jgi:hypothetical protein
MKTIHKILFFIIFAILVQACDKIEMPYKETGGETGGTATKKVLLEDYTGHLCPNCPTAGKKALDLQELYDGKLIVMAVHAGYFATPLGSPFDDDFRCEAGNTWDDFFGISNAGNPNGMINRQNTGGNYIIGDGLWPTTVAEIIDEEAVATIEIATTYNASNRKLDIELSSELLSALDGNYKVQVCLVEDSLIGAQKNSDASLGGAVILNFVHHHVLREAVNSSWGTDMVAGGGQTAVNTIYTHNFSLTLNDAYNASHCSVIAWIFNGVDYSIIQVEEKKIQ